MNKYIVTCSIDNRELSAVTFDSRRAATSYIKRTIKALGAKIRFKERGRVDWDISKQGINAAFRLMAADEGDVSYVLKRSKGSYTHQFVTRTESLKYIAKLLHKISYLKGLGSGKWHTTIAGIETSLHLTLVVGNGTRKTDYDLLGLKNNATAEEAKKAYRNKVKSVHPDHGGTEQDMKDLNEAYKNITSGKSKLDGNIQEFNSVTTQFLSHRLSHTFNSKQSARRVNQLGLRQITLGIGSIVFSGIVTNATDEATNTGAIYIAVVGLIIFGAYYLIRGIVNSIRN